MTWDRIHRLELELAQLQAVLAEAKRELDHAIKQRDDARTVAVRLEQELAEVTA